MHEPFVKKNLATEMCTFGNIIQLDDLQLSLRLQAITLRPLSGEINYFPY